MVYIILNNVQVTINYPNKLTIWYTRTYIRLGETPYTLNVPTPPQLRLVLLPHPTHPLAAHKILLKIVQ